MRVITGLKTESVEISVCVCVCVLKLLWNELLFHAYFISYLRSFFLEKKKNQYFLTGLALLQEMFTFSL